ncbi:hypothetical protein D3C75_961220 [compost metagenome]
MLLQRHNPVYSRIREGYGDIRFGAGLPVQLGIHQLFELGAAADGIFAGNDMQRSGGDGHPSADAFRNHTGNMLKDGYSDSRGDQISFSNGRRHFLRMGHAAQRSHIFDDHGFLSFTGQCHRIFLTLLKLGDKSLINIDEAYFIPRLRQQ